MAESRLNDREMASSMSKPTEARSSAMAGADGKQNPKNVKNDGLGQIIECKYPSYKLLSMCLIKC